LDLDTLDFSLRMVYLWCLEATAQIWGFYHYTSVGVGSPKVTTNWPKGTLKVSWVWPGVLSRWTSTYTCTMVKKPWRKFWFFLHIINIPNWGSLSWNLTFPFFIIMSFVLLNSKVYMSWFCNLASFSRIP
jgi:hypothetical protein